MKSRNGRSIEATGMSEAGEMASRGTDEAGGNLTGRERETEAETDTGSGMPLRARRPSDSSTTRGAGKTDSSAMKPRNRSLDVMRNPQPQKSNPILSCRGH